MPIGPGGLDSNGIWQFGEDDSEALASDLLNLGMASISTEVGLLDAAVAAIVTGQILQVVSTTKTDTFSESLAGGAISSEVVTGLTATITPSSTSSKIMIRVCVHVADESQYGYGGFVFRRGSTAIGLPDVSGSRPRLSAQGGVLINSAEDLALLSMDYEDYPVSTSPITYGISRHNADASSEVVYVNRSSGNPNNVRFANPISTITLMEVAG